MDEPKFTYLLQPLGLASAAYGEVHTSNVSEFSRNGSSLFADPVAWLMTEAVSRAISSLQAEVLTNRDGIGLIVLSERCTLDTMQLIARSTPKGRISPLKFAGANSGSISGLACIRNGFRGPTLTLSMPPEVGITAALVIAGNWIKRGNAHAVIVGAHDFDGAQHSLRAHVIQAADASGGCRPEGTDPDTATNVIAEAPIGA